MLTEEYVLSFDHMSLRGRHIFINKCKAIDADGIIKITIDRLPVVGDCRTTRLNRYAYEIGNECPYCGSARQPSQQHRTSSRQAAMQQGQQAFGGHQ